MAIGVMFDAAKRPPTEAASQCSRKATVVKLARYLAKNTPPEKRAFLRAAAAVMIAYTLGLFVLFLCF
jgi:hypothetical protein